MWIPAAVLTIQFASLFKALKITNPELYTPTQGMAIASGGD